MLGALMLAALLSEATRPNLTSADDRAIHLVGEVKFKPPTGHLEDMMGDGLLDGFPVIPCDGFAPAVSYWRVGCVREGRISKLVVANEDGRTPTVLATLDYRPLFLRSVGLHDRIIIRTIRKAENGEAIAADYVWKPPQD
jgi:hypothetical protein